jgi:hypothetical protein
VKKDDQALFLKDGVASKSIFLLYLIIKRYGLLISCLYNETALIPIMAIHASVTLVSFCFCNGKSIRLTVKDWKTQPFFYKVYLFFPDLH